MIKKLFYLVIVALVLSCNPEKEDDRFSIVTTVYPYYLMANQIYGQYFKIEYLPFELDEKGISFFLDEVIENKIISSDLVLINGLNMEHDLKPVLDKVQSRLFTASDILAPESIISNSEKVSNPYIWLSPENMLKIAQALKDSLEPKTIAFSGAIEQNFQFLKDSILQIDNEIRLERRQYEFSRFNVSNNTFSYFFNEYKIEQKIIDPAKTDILKIKERLSLSPGKLLFSISPDLNEKAALDGEVNFFQLDLLGLDSEAVSLVELYRNNWDFIKTGMQM